MENILPKRKRNRLEKYDYSSTGAYFITVCTKDRKPILSNICCSVGVGALDDPRINTLDVSFLNVDNFKLQLTSIGEVVEKNLLSSEKISGVTIDKYVIMPDHIHVIIFLNSEKYVDIQNGSSRASTPTANAMLPRIISAFKRFVGKELGNDIFQRGYMEHIIRDKKDYETRVKYIYENPMRWYYKRFENIDG